MRTIIFGFVLLLVCLIVVPAWAQGYTVLPITALELDPDSTDSKVRSNVTKAKFQIQDSLRNNDPLTAENQQLITKFFSDAYFRSWTRPKSSNKAGMRRIEFLKSFYGPTFANPQARPFLNDLTLRVMKEYIKPKYHPVVRFNAMLLIGDLKSREYANGSSTPEVPLPAALSVIVNALKDKTQSDPVKVAALLGLRKHCELVPNRAANQIAAILDIAKGYIAADEPPAGSAPDAHMWMRRQAIDIVGILGSGGKNGEFAGLLDHIITNDELPLKIRCSAIATKGKLAFDPNSAKQLDLLKDSTNIGKVALEAVKSDIEWFDTAMTKYTDDKLNPGGSSSGYGGGMLSSGYAPGISTYDDTTSGYSDLSGGYGGSGRSGRSKKSKKVVKPIKPVDPILNRIQLTFRRRMKYHLDSAKQGLVGTLTEAPSDPRTLQSGLMRYAKNANEASDAKSLVDPIIALLNQVDQQEIEEKELLSSVQSELEVLTRAVQKLAAGPKGALPPAAANRAADLPGAALPGGLPGTALPGAGTAPDLPGGAIPALPGGGNPDLPGGGNPALPGGAGPAGDLPGGLPAP